MSFRLRWSISLAILIAVSAVASQLSVPPAQAAAPQKRAQLSDLGTRMHLQLFTSALAQYYPEYHKEKADPRLSTYLRRFASNTPEDDLRAMASAARRAERVGNKVQQALRFADNLRIDGQVPYPDMHAALEDLLRKRVNEFRRWRDFVDEMNQLLPGNLLADVADYSGFITVDEADADCPLLAACISGADAVESACYHNNVVAGLDAGTMGCPAAANDGGGYKVSTQESGSASGPAGSYGAFEAGDGGRNACAAAAVLGTGPGASAKGPADACHSQGQTGRNSCQSTYGCDDFRLLETAGFAVHPEDLDAILADLDALLNDLLSMFEDLQEEAELITERGATVYAPGAMATLDYLLLRFVQVMGLGKPV